MAKERKRCLVNAALTIAAKQMRPQCNAKSLTPDNTGYLFTQYICVDRSKKSGGDVLALELLTLQIVIINHPLRSYFIHVIYVQHIYIHAYMYIYVYSDLASAFALLPDVCQFSIEDINNTSSLPHIKC
jgi:hypothetical protein